jgi:hypothetical protein
VSNVYKYVLNGIEVWQGKSAASGFRTRLFATFEAAEAEENWLDSWWTWLKADFQTNALEVGARHESKLRDAFQNLMLAYSQGAYPALTLDESGPLVAWRVCGPNEVKGFEDCAFVMFENDELVGAVPYDLRQVEEFKRDWRMRRVRPSSL